MAYTKEEWWITDSEGRRIGWLHPEDMSMIAEGMYGRRWVAAFARDYGFSRSVVDRWKDGRIPIPKHIAMIFSMMATLSNHKIPIAPVEASWLPEGDGANSPARDDPADAG